MSSGSAQRAGGAEGIGEEDLLQVIAPDGTIDAQRDPGLPESTLREAFRHLCLVRALDTRMLSLQRQGRIGFYVPSIGEEASQVGSAMALEPQDWVFPAYREPGCALWRGVPLRALVAQSYGNALDVMKGRQMPNHYGYRDIHYVTASSPVGTQVPQAVGAAMAAKIRKDPVVVLAYFGDGATSGGDFHAGMNFAGVFRTSTVLFCKNNQWAISVPLSRQTAAKTLAQKARAYGFEGVRVDGNDVLAVYAATKAAVDKARGGGGPTMIEALTYRVGPHSSSDDPSRYRSKEEEEFWKRRDPIERMRTYLKVRGLWTQDWGAALQKGIDDQLSETVREVEKAPPPALETMFTDVYEELSPRLREQMEAFLASGERRRPEISDRFPL